MCLKRDNATLLGEYEHLDNKSLIEFICNCGNIYTKLFKCIYRGSGSYCNTCSIQNKMNKYRSTNLINYGVEYTQQNKDIRMKREQTCMEKYGTKNILGLTDIKNKIKETNIKRYGINCPSKLQKTKDAMKQTNLEKYGVTSPSQLQNIKDKIKTTKIQKYGKTYPLQTEEIRNKIKSTMLERYGVEYPTQSIEIQSKIKKTNLKRYGVEYPSQLEEIKDKIKKTNLKKYCVDTPLKSDMIKDKIKQTCFIKYGVENPQQSQQIQEKTQINSRKYKTYKMPSGIIRKVQGYEHFALDELIKLYPEELIKTDRSDVPHIIYQIDNKNKYYFPDIFIPHENYIIEVKSTWTYKSKIDSINKKAEACRNQGYKYEIWIYDRNGNKELISS
jgi:hypothetical protein